MKSIITILLLVLLCSCSKKSYLSTRHCNTYKYVKKPKVSTNQYFPMQAKIDIFGNKVHRAWELNK